MQACLFTNNVTAHNMYELLILFQTYVADIFLAQSWRDQRLRLPENMSEDYRILDVEWLHEIWRPDCFFKNAKKVTFHEMSIPNHYLWLYHDKTLLYMSKYGFMGMLHSLMLGVVPEKQYKILNKKTKSSLNVYRVL